MSENIKETKRSITPYISIIVSILAWITELLTNAISDNFNLSPEATLFVITVFTIIATVSVFFIWHIKRTEIQRQEIAQCKNGLAETSKELKEIQERIDRALEIEELWTPVPLVADTHFVPSSERQTRFISVFNLKGGVGKTTLTAFLSAYFATRSTEPLRTLVIDLDFQHTLSERCLSSEVLEEKQKTGTTSHRLIETKEEIPLKHLICPFATIDGASIISTGEELERTDALEQARFLLDPATEVRFQYRKRLHTQAVLANYDLVLFDCPPRLTTSSVNALACSDYYVIPTKLEHDSTNAIARTIQWVNKLRHVAQPRLLGIITNEVPFRANKPIQDYADRYKIIQNQVLHRESGEGEVFIFNHMVRENRTMVLSARGRFPFDKPDVLETIQPLAEELLEKIK